MSDFKVAHRYAKSLLDEAVKQGKEDEVKKDLEYILNSSTESRDLRLMLENPIIKYDKKYAILEKIFKSGISELSIKFVNLVCKKERAEILIPITREYINQYNLYKNVSIASIKTAIKMDDKLRKEFVSIIEKSFGKNIELREEVDEELIGGFILRMNDRQIDESIQSKLNQLKLNLIDHSYNALV